MSTKPLLVLFIAIFTVGPYLAFTKRLPFTSHGYQLKATFADGVGKSNSSVPARPDWSRLVPCERTRR